MEPLENNTAAASPNWAGLKVRIISSVSLIVLFVTALAMGGWLFTSLIMIAGLQMMREWDVLTARDNRYWSLAGLFYIAIPCTSLLWLRTQSGGMELVLFVMLIVWATDIGAYFTGRKIGGPKLAPVISPGKTWAGLGGGILCATVTGGVAFFFTPYPASPVYCLGLGAFFAILAQTGDLFESWLKRRVGAKDSGSCIPGHGGLLDRVDGLMFVLPVFAFMVFIGYTAP